MTQPGPGAPENASQVQLHQLLRAMIEKGASDLHITTGQSPLLRIDGDVIYVADLLDRNEVLRHRFGDRTWYSLAVTRDAAGRLGAKLMPYRAPNAGSEP